MDESAQRAVQRATKAVATIAEYQADKDKVVEVLLEKLIEETYEQFSKDLKENPQSNTEKELPGNSEETITFQAEHPSSPDVSTTIVL